MKNGTQQIWSRLRGVFVDELTFSEIKNVAGSAGVSVARLAHLVQQEGATKDALMSAVDGLFAKLSTEEQDGFVADFIREAVERKSKIRERIEPLLDRLGCSIDEDNQLIRGEETIVTKHQESRTGVMQPVIFISHSSADSDLAEALVELLEKALRLEPNEVRCTSVDGYRLPVGTNIDQQLRTEIEESQVLIAVVTASALTSTYVLFELGARWVLRKPLFPLLAKGTLPSALKEPLKAHAAFSCDNRVQVQALVEDVAAKTARSPIKPSAYEKAIGRVVEASKKREPIIPTPKTSRDTITVDLPELSATEIFSLQAVMGGLSYRPMAEEIIAENLGITVARARQALESIRKKRLVTCRPDTSGDSNYEVTEHGRAWLQKQASTTEP